MTPEQHESVVEALGNISAELEIGFVELFLAPLVATFLGAYFAYRLSIRQGDKDEVKRTRATLARDLALEISALDAACAHYWSADCGAVSPADELHRATIVKSKFAYVRRLVSEFRKQIPSDGSASEIQHALTCFYDSGFEIATQGDFESVSRQADPERIARISELSSVARAMLSRYF